MRLIDLQEQLKARKKMSINTALFYSVPLGIILFLLTISGGFFEAILFGFLVFAVIFVSIYLIRELTHKSVDRKRNKMTLEHPVLDVRYYGEIGLLEITDKAFVFRTLTPGGQNKEFSIEIDNELMITVGQILYKPRQKLLHKGIKEGYILLVSESSGSATQFIFYDVDHALEKVTEMLSKFGK